MPQPPRASVEQLLVDQLATLQRAMRSHHDIMSMMLEQKPNLALQLNDSPTRIGGSPSKGASRNEDDLKSLEVTVSDLGKAIADYKETIATKRCQDFGLVSERTFSQDQQMAQSARSDQDARIGCGGFTFCSISKIDENGSDSSRLLSPSQQPSGLTLKGGMREPLLATVAGKVDDGPREATERTSSKKSNRKTYNHFFTNQREVKSKIDELLAKVTDSPEDHYSDTGIWQALARSERFQNAALFVIVLNCLWLAFDTQCDHADFIWYAPTLFWVVDNSFCTVFTIEIFIRFRAFKTWTDAFKYGSFIFDGVLVGSMVWDTWIVTLLIICLQSTPTGTGHGAATIFRVLRLFRMFRIARVVRLLNKVPDLAILVKGMLLAMRATMSVLMLVGLVIYIFSIVFMQLLQRRDDVANGQFRNFGTAVHLLLMQVLCGPDGDLLTDMLHAGFTYYIVYIFYLLVAQLTIMNMLIGILCDVISNVSDDEKEEAFEAELNDFLIDVAQKLDRDGSGTLSKDEFDEMFKDPEITAAVAEMGMDVVGLSDYAAFIFIEVEELSYADFYHMLSQFRTGSAVTLKDLMDLRKYLVVELEELAGRLQE